jgi:hypothetical protein
VKQPQGVELDEYGFILVDLNNVGHKDDPWILPERVHKYFLFSSQNMRKSLLLSLENKESSDLTMSLKKKNTTSFMRCPFLLIQKVLVSLKQESATQLFFLIAALMPMVN